MAKIDLAELEKLAAMQCTDEEIAAWFGVTTRTIERRRKVRRFNEVMERGKAKGRVSVRRMQLKLLEQGNATMGVWLGKQVLGQTDQVTHNLQRLENIQVVMMPRLRELGLKDLEEHMLEDGAVIDVEPIDEGLADES
jgi:hypothetical protein